MAGRIDPGGANDGPPDLPVMASAPPRVPIDTPDLSGLGPTDEYGLTMPDSDASLRVLGRYNDLRSTLQPGGLAARREQQRQQRLQSDTEMEKLRPVLARMGIYGNTPGTSIKVTSESNTAPTMKMPGSTVTGQMPSRQQQAMNFAKALGFDIPADDPDGTNASAVHQAFLKATRGMSVAKLLSPKHLDKTRELFNKLLTESANQTRQAPSGPMPSVRPPVQPS